MMLKLVMMMNMHMQGELRLLYCLLLRLAACMEMVVVDDACMGMPLHDV